jgi:hypothetical protein
MLELRCALGQVAVRREAQELEKSEIERSRES